MTDNRIYGTRAPAPFSWPRTIGIAFAIALQLSVELSEVGVMRATLISRAQRPAAE